MRAGFEKISLIAEAVGANYSHGELKSMLYAEIRRVTHFDYHNSTRAAASAFRPGILFNDIKCPLILPSLILLFPVTTGEKILLPASNDPAF